MIRTGSILRVVSLAGVVAVATACTAVLGIEDTTLEEKAATPKAKSLTVTPDKVNLGIGYAKQLTAKVTFEDGSIKDVSSTAVWASEDPNVATVSATGEVTGNTVGVTKVTATSNGLSASTEATVIDWICPDKVAKTGKSSIKIRVFTVDVSNGMPVGGIRFRACSSPNDAACASKLAETVTSSDAASTGAGELTIPIANPDVGFTGYLQITGTDTSKGFIEFHYFFSSALFDDIRLPASVMVAGPALNGLIGAITGMPNPQNRPDRSHVSATPLDCSGLDAARDLTGTTDPPIAKGIAFKLDPNPPSDAVPFYFQSGGVPTPSPPATATDGAGPGGFLYVQQQIYAISASQGTIPVSKATIITRKDVFSTVLMLPQPQ